MYQDYMNYMDYITHFRVQEVTPAMLAVLDGLSREDDKRKHPIATALLLLEMCDRLTLDIHSVISSAVRARRDLALIDVEHMRATRDMLQEEYP